MKAIGQEFAHPPVGQSRGGKSMSAPETPFHQFFVPCALTVAVQAPPAQRPPSDSPAASAVFTGSDCRKSLDRQDSPLVAAPTPE